MNRYGNGRGGRPWRRTVERIKQRDGYRCRACGRVTIEGDVDHVIPLAKGGTDDDSNLAWLCRVPCHRDKTIRENGGKPKRAVDADGWPV